LSLGLFATGQYGVQSPTGTDTTHVVEGLFYGGGLDQVKAQFIGSATCMLLVGGFALIMFWVIRQLPGSYNLRLEKDGELEGIDIHEHGTPAYHMEFGYGMSYTTPVGTSGPGNGGLGVGTHDPESESVPT